MLSQSFQLSPCFSHIEVGEELVSEPEVTLSVLLLLSPPPFLGGWEEAISAAVVAKSAPDPSILHFLPKMRLLVVVKFSGSVSEFFL